MITRRSLLLTSCAAAMIPSGAVLAGQEHPFTTQAFNAAQSEGRPILVEIHASWCPTCKAQAPILSRLLADPKFKNIVVFRVDFDSQKTEVRNFKARMQSTLITYQGSKETGRSVGDTNPDSIADLLSLAL